MMFKNHRVLSFLLVLLCVLQHVEFALSMQQQSEFAIRRENRDAEGNRGEKLQSEEKGNELGESNKFDQKLQSFKNRYEIILKNFYKQTNLTQFYKEEVDLPNLLKEIDKSIQEVVQTFTESPQQQHFLEELSALKAEIQSTESQTKSN